MMAEMVPWLGYLFFPVRQGNELWRRHPAMAPQRGWTEVCWRHSSP
jgi:hypothetical protein